MSIYNVSGDSIDKVYSSSGMILEHAYDVSGATAWNRRTHNVSKNFKSTLLYDLPEIGSGTQGIACDSLSQTIAQLYTDRIITIDLSDGSYVRRSPTFINLGHGGAGMFSKQKINQSDMFPPLWISTQQTTTIDTTVYGRFIEVYVYEDHVVTNRTFAIELPSSGNTLFAFDLDNNIVYSVLYSSYNRPSSGDSWGSITAYDMTKGSQFYIEGDSFGGVNGNFLLENPLDTFEIPFLSEVQSVSYFDGLVVSLSDEGKVVFYDVETHQVYLTIDSGIVPFEREGVGFIENPLTGKTDMILSARQPTFNVYYRYEFIL